MKWFLKLLGIIVGFFFVFLIPVIMGVQFIEGTFWHPSEDQLEQMKLQPNYCYHNADCREKVVEFDDCQWTEYNRYSKDAGEISYVPDTPTSLECLPIHVPLCIENECTTKVLGIW